MKAITAQIRQAVKAEGIKCGVAITDRRSFRITTPTYRKRFNSDQIRTFCQIAKDMGLICASLTEIDPTHEAVLTGKHQWNFSVRDNLKKEI